MLFNSIEFAIFLPIVFALYWFVTNRHLKFQNLLLLVSSYIFYGWWDWRFLSLLFISSTIDYIVGIGLSKEENPFKRKILLLTSICLNLGLLGFFKYYNFFIDSLAESFTFFGTKLNVNTLNIILPVGISFYTFQSLSYGIDVYRRKLEPTRDIIAFLTFVSFFPQLVAGPIERGTNLLHQFFKPRKFDYPIAVDGIHQILWGLFKKIVVADNCSPLVNDIFIHYKDYAGSTLLLGAFFFAMQIYCDFSGYSDIAIGTARLFGFSLMRNFSFPYFSRDIAEFWRRWHISLSTWFRDYLYFPLGGSKGGTWMKIRNTFIIFTVSGFWHGAEWTFVAWGFINACYFLPLLLAGQNRKNLNIAAEGKVFPGIQEGLQIGFTFFLTLLAWVFFRAENIHHAFSYLSGIFSPSLFKISIFMYDKVMILIPAFLAIEWLQRTKQHALQLENFKIPRWTRWCIFYTVLFIIFWLGGTQQEFIYFQF